MNADRFQSIAALVASAEPDRVREGLELTKQELSQAGPSEAQRLFDVVCSIFYIDPLDRPELVPQIEAAVELIPSFGDWVIPVLIDRLDAGDLKAQMAVAHALGRIGERAIQPLVTQYESSDEPGRRSFVLYALGKIKSAKLLNCTRLVLDALQSLNLELRDTGTRAVGKFAESIHPSQLPEDVRLGFIKALQQNLGDPSPGIRAKAVRSLGKLARFGHLKEDEREGFRATCRLILGVDEHYEWDRAYVVRKEAEEALKYM